MHLSLGISPCPNDTFIFEALMHNRIGYEHLNFDVHIQEVQELNTIALQSTYDITKLSYFAMAHCMCEYEILDSGSALGFKNGPLLICNQDMVGKLEPHMIVALPGEHTTAHVLFSMAFPEYANKKFMVFSEIEQAIKKGEVAAGVIIHENRFTYADRGFVAIQDLGDFWETKTQLPIPLGCIAVKRSLPFEVKKQIQEAIKASIQFANQNPEIAKPFICSHAQEMEEDVMQKHISLFVNDFSLSLGDTGRKAIETFYAELQQQNLCPQFDLHKVFFNS